MIDAATHVPSEAAKRFAEEYRGETPPTNLAGYLRHALNVELVYDRLTEFYEEYPIDWAALFK